LHRYDIALPLSGIEQQIECKPHSWRGSSIELCDGFIRPAFGYPFLFVQFEKAPRRIVSKRQALMLNRKLPKRTYDSHA